MSSPPFFLTPPPDAAPIAWNAHDELDFDQNVKFTYFAGRVGVRVDDVNHEDGYGGHGVRVTVSDPLLSGDEASLRSLALSLGTMIVNGLLSSRLREEQKKGHLA